MTVKEIGNGIFEVLRLATVHAGYFPDIAEYLSPKDPIGFRNAKDVILSHDKELIEVFNVGGYNSRPRRKTNDITLDRVVTEIAKRGTLPVVVYEENTDGKTEQNELPEVKRFIKLFTAKNLYDITFQLQYIAYSEEYAAIIEHLINRAIGSHATLYGYNEMGEPLDEYFVILRTGSFDTSGTDFIERGWTFIVPAKDLDGLTTVGEISENVEIKIALEDLEANNLLEITIPAE